jgi:phosphohistidine swiveling domain-containing protein
MRVDRRRIEQIEWIKTVTRAMSPCIQIFQMIGMRDFLLEKVGSGLRNIIFFPAEGGHTQYFGKEDWTNFAKAVKARTEEKDWLKKFVAECYEMGEEYVKYSKSVFRTSLCSKTNKELLRYFQEFGEHRLKLAYSLYPPLIIEQILENEIKNELIHKLKENHKEALFEKYWATINTKTQLNDADKEEIELLKIAVEVQEKGGIYNKQIDNKLQKHAEEFCWLPYYGFNLPIWGKEHFRQELEKIENPDKKLIDKEKKYKDQNELVQRIKEEFKETPLKELVEIVQIFLHLRSYRTEVMRKTQYYVRPLLEEMAKRIGIEFNNFLLLTPEEIRVFFEKGVQPAMNEVKERGMHHAIIMVSGSIEIISNQGELESLRKMLVAEEERKLTLKGTGVFPGKVRGTVKVIANIREAQKVRNGDILVTSMTTPEMHRIIERVAGIITDEGGLTCHAAMVSRELHIPCVIGTGTATQTLRDGNIVILDSEKGIIEVEK